MEAVSLNPSYLGLREDELEERVGKLHRILESCELCPRKCRVNRLESECGYCGAGREAAVSSYVPHFGEEPELVGMHGSGAIFLTRCNLLCLYCQNYDISHLGYGEIKSAGQIAGYMLSLQRAGCHNINFVTPTHFAPQLAKAVSIAAGRGLSLPVVWNCSGYENVQVVRLLEGIVDIYMPDIKYSRSDVARKYSDAPDYFDRCCESVREMHRQVGDLKVDGGRVAYRGLLVRHLVLPNDLAGSGAVLEFLAGLSRDTYVNIMAQYRPCGDAYRYRELARQPTPEEYLRVIETARRLGLHRGFRTGIPFL